MAIPKEKIPESKISFVETGKVELNFRVPNLLPGAIIHIVRDMRRTLENCANLNLLNEFIETRIVEYEEVSVKETN
ncbi:MAG: hypothetical protein U9N01_05235 [Euryarchaeota archaeon]|nr:hypothetical protein [Euryarchaeota archaeon]